MILGKNSAILGFGLFFIIVLLLITSAYAIASCDTLGIIAGILNIIVNGYIYYNIYKILSNEEETSYRGPKIR